MAEVRWIKMTLCVTLLLQFTVGQSPPSFTARAGHEVTLPCTSVTKNQDKCGGTSWLFSHYDASAAVELINLGQIGNSVAAKLKSNRLNVTSDCSMIIRNVTVEDAGRYTCRRFRSGQQQGPDAVVVLSVVTVTEDKDTLFCTVSTYGQCGHTVKWLFEGNTSNMDITQLSCSARVTFSSLHLNHKSNYYELLKCNVTDDKSGNMLLCNVGPRSSCTKTGGSTTARKNDSSSAKNDREGWLWLYILVCVGLAALSAAIVIVLVIRWRRTKGNQTQTDKTTVDPDDSVSYASVSYTKTSGTAQVLGGGGGDEGGGAVTYSSVKASSSSSADLSDLYATVNKPNK